MTDDHTLVEALRAAGHTDAANAVRDKALAGQLREAGHDALAEALANGTTPPAPAAQATAQPPTEREQGQTLLDAMRRQGILKDEEEN